MMFILHVSMSSGHVIPMACSNLCFRSTNLQLLLLLKLYLLHPIHKVYIKDHFDIFTRWKKHTNSASAKPLKVTKGKYIWKMMDESMTNELIITLQLKKKGYLFHGSRCNLRVKQRAGLKGT